jgi:hypothetical protein
MDLKSKFLHLCDPAKLYLVLAFISIIVMLFSKIKISIVLMKLIFILIWVFILNFICKKGYVGVSWFLVLLPYILMILALLGMGMKKMKM